MSMQNPYAPPKDFGMLPGAFAPGSSPRGFATREVLEAAWEITKKHWPVLVAAVVVWMVPGGLASSVPTVALLLRLVEPDSAEYWGIYAASTFASQLIGCFFQVGFIRISLAAARGQTPEFFTIFGGFDRFLPFLAMTLIYVFMVAFGSLLLIVPGVIIFLALGLATFYCVDARLGPIAALAESWNTTRGHRWRFFVFFCTATLVYMVGLMACCVGALPALGLIYVAWALVYIRLSGHERAPFETQGA